MVWGGGVWRGGRLGRGGVGGVQLPRFQSRLMGMAPEDVARPATVSENHLRQMICNSMSVNVLERLLARCLFSLGLMASPLSPHWESPAAATSHVATMTRRGSMSTSSQTEQRAHPRLN